MKVVERLIAILLQVIVVSFLAGLATYGFWAVFSRVPTGMIMGMLLGAIFASGLIWGIGRLFRLRGNFSLTLLAALIGVPLTLLALGTPFMHQFGYAQTLMLQVTSCVLATAAYQWDDMRGLSANSKAVQHGERVEIISKDHH